MVTQPEPAVPAAPLRLHFQVVDPRAETLARQIAPLSRFARSLRDLFRLSFAAVLGFCAVFLLDTLLDALARWPGQ